MTLIFPRDVVFEAFLGRWVEITSLAEGRSVRQSDPLTIIWGSGGEQAGALSPPSTFEGWLNNVGGHWTPGNPMSDYFAYLQGRNIPTRLALRVSRASFSGSSGFSLSTTDTGESFTTSGVNDSYSVAAGVGNITLSAVASFGLGFIGDSYPDCESRITFDVGGVTPTGAPIEPGNPIVRYQASGAFAGEHYMLRVEVRTDNTIWISIHHSTLGSLSGGLVPAGLTNAPGRKFTASLYAEGQTLRGQIWDASNPDRPGYLVQAHHDRLSGGFPGFRAGVAAGNTNAKPFTMAHDNWELRLYRHYGELASLKPTWDTSHRVKKAAFKCADITQRLGKAQRPSLSSAPRRYLASNTDFTATDHWPLDESATAPTQGVNAVAGGSPISLVRDASVSPNRGAVTWGVADPSNSVVPGFATASNGMKLVLPINSGPLGSQFSIMFAIRLTPDAEVQVLMNTAAGGTNHFAIVLRQHSTGIYEIFGNNGAVNLGTGALPYAAGIDGRWITVGFSVRNNGANNIAYTLFLDGVDQGTGAWFTGGTYSALTQATLFVRPPNTGGQGDTGFSSVFLTSTQLDTVVGGHTVISQAHRVLKGWAGETALARAIRLCDEEDVSFDYYGDPSATRTMGPQRPIPLMDQLVECAEADGAFLFAPRYSAGIAMRPRRIMGSRAPDCTLAYSSGHVAPPLAPAADDRPTANLVRAERIGGGFQIIEQVAGPMNTRTPDASPFDPDAAGRTPADARGNLESDAQLGDLGGWVRALGTVPEVRFPRVAVNLRATELTTGVDPTRPAREVTALKPGDRLVVTGLGAADVYRDLDQIVRGGVEVISNVRQHKISFNVAPYEKYRSAIFGDAAVPGSRYDSGGVTTIDAQLTSGTTGARNVTVASGMRWTIDASAFATAFYVLIGGELIQLSGITGTGPGQVMTILTRNLNGLPIAGGKTHPAGTPVVLFQPVYYA